MKRLLNPWFYAEDTSLQGLSPWVKISSNSKSREWELHANLLNQLGKQRRETKHIDACMMPVLFAHLCWEEWCYKGSFVNEVRFLAESPALMGKHGWGQCPRPQKRKTTCLKDLKKSCYCIWINASFGTKDQKRWIAGIFLQKQAKVKRCIFVGSIWMLHESSSKKTLPLKRPTFFLFMDRSCRPWRISGLGASCCCGCHGW